MKTRYKLLLGMMIIMTLVSLTNATITNNGDGTHTLSYTVSTETAIEMKDAMCHNYAYQEEIYVFNETLMEEVPTPNPESCAEFADKQIKKFIKNNIIAYRTHVEQEVAKQNIQNMSEPTIN